MKWLEDTLDYAHSSRFKERQAQRREKGEPNNNYNNSLWTPPIQTLHDPQKERRKEAEITGLEHWQPEVQMPSWDENKKTSEGKISKPFRQHANTPEDSALNVNMAMEEELIRNMSGGEDMDIYTLAMLYGYRVHFPEITSSTSETLLGSVTINKSKRKEQVPSQSHSNM